MKKQLKYITALFTLISLALSSQNQTKKWYFGATAGLDFMGAPGILTNGVMNPWEGCASIADAAGNLLFYTDGIQVWNKNHVQMPNGFGLMGNSSSTQSGVIVQRPGSPNIYYIFTEDAQAAPNGLRYSTVDMTLAAGLGDIVTGTKNTPLYTPSDEKITAVRHCNGVDVWVITHDWNSNNFRTYLVTSAGVGAAVNSAVGTVHNGSNANTIGQMKASPNGRKIALGIHDTPFNAFEIYDFNNSTGVVSNPLVLGNTFNWAYGVEFSPDGTKLYGGKYGGGGTTITQWDICQPTNAAILASQVTVATPAAQVFAFQLATNGKIYVARISTNQMGVINNPNASGAACNYVDLGQSIAPRTNNLGLPNFITSFLKTVPPPPTYTVNSAVSCLTASFTPPAVVTMTCASAGYSVTGLTWNFGDPPSGPANTSTLNSPTHTYPGPGTYTAQLIINYSCSADTVKVPVSIVSPSVTITTNPASCSAPGSATATPGGGTGPYSYTWTPSAQTTQVATGLTAGIYTVTVKDNGGGCVVTATANLGSVNAFSGTVTTTSVTCNGASTGTAGITVSGGSGTTSYSWSPGSQTTSGVTGLIAGTYTVKATDVVSGCSVTKTVQIAQPPALTLNVAASSPSACAGSSITLTASNTGGTGPSYTYTWTSGPTTNTYVVTQAVSGNYTYSVASTDANNCSSSSTISVSFINQPTVTATSATVCVGSAATLTAAGASAYTWTPGNATGSIFTLSPGATTPVTVLGANGSCTASSTATITVNALPTPTAGNTGPYCPGATIQLNGSSASTYTWSGPSAFASNAQSPSISTATTANGGVYTFSVTDANGCKNSATTNVVVNSTPLASTGNVTVCLNQTINLSANGGSTYAWSGPQAFTSGVQNPSVSNAQINMSGAYTVTVTSAVGCTNTAIANVTVYPLPAPAIVSNTPCVGGTLNLLGSGGATYLWNGPGYSGAQQNPTINNVSLATGGTYTLIASAGTCSASITASVTINPLPVPVLNSNSPVCIGLPINFTGNGGVNYAWAGPGLVSNTQNPTIAAASPGNTGTYTLTVTDANNCVNKGTINVVVNGQPVVNATGAKGCENSAINLSANGGVSYSWSGPNGFTSNAQNPNIPSIAMTNAGQYTVIVTDANTCTNTAVANLTVNPAPTPNIQVNSPICLNNILGMSGGGGVSYSWSGPNGFFSTSQTPTIMANSTAYSGNYNVTVTDANGCSASASAGATVNPIPTALVVSSTNIGCAPVCVTFTCTSSSAIKTYNWNMGNGATSVSSSVQQCYATTGTYTVNVSVIDNAGCSNSTTHTVEVYPQPVADFNYDPINPVESIDEVHFTDASYGAQIGSWSWYFMNTAQYTSTLQNPSFTYVDQGEYAVALVVKSKQGCADTVVKSIVVGEDFGIYVPNAFSPNGDGLNDIFYAKGFGVKKFEMQIFDRWGERVFASEDMNNSWDGTIKGKMGKEDTYTWRIKLVNVNGKSKELTGHVTLIK